MNSASPRPARSGGLWPVPERSILGSVLGVPAIVAVALATVATAAGVFVDLQRSGNLGAIFKICYFTGCVLAVAWVRRRSLFGPMVQAPLLLALTVPAVVLFGGGPPSSGRFAERVLQVALPLINGFPTMAVTTVAVVCIAVFRYLTQRMPRTDMKPARAPGVSGQTGKSGKSGKSRSGRKRRGGPKPLRRAPDRGAVL